MTRKEVQEAKERCAKASKPPWIATGVGVASCGGNRKPIADFYMNHPGAKKWYENLQFTAHARMDLPAALDMLNRAMSVVEEVATTGVSFEDERVRYMEVQVDRRDVLAARKLFFEWEGKGSKVKRRTV